MIFNNLIYKLRKIINPYKMAIIAVIISVLATAIVAGISSVGKNVISHEMSGIGMSGLSVVLYGENAENLTDLAFYKSLKRLGDIEKITPVLYDYANVKFNNNTAVDTMAWGIAKDAQEIVALTIISGRMINDADINSNSFVCLVDEELARLAYKRSNIIGKSILLTIGGRGYTFKIIGSIKKGSSVLNNMVGDIIPNFIYIPYTTMNNISHKTNLDQIILKSSNTDFLSENLMKDLMFYYPEYQNSAVKLTDLTQQKAQIMKIVDTAFFSLFMVSCVAVLVCSISVGASVNTAVSIRQKDIGIKMSLGASRFSITMEFLFSAILSCVIGVVIAGVIAAVALKLFLIFFNIAITFEPILIIISIFATISLTAIFSLFPSYQAANLEPIKALNRE
ncbi:MAG: ABC transporter permease [Oscillospiraceae bacterium]